MKLEELLKLIDDFQDFILFKGDRIGSFNKIDLGVEPYLNAEVWKIEIEDEIFEISLKY